MCASENLSVITCLIWFFEDFFAKPPRFFLWSWLICDCVWDYFFYSHCWGLWVVCFLVRRFLPHICTTTHASEESNARLPLSFLVIVVSIFQVVVQKCPHFRLQCPTALWTLKPCRMLCGVQRPHPHCSCWTHKQFWFQKIDSHRLRWLKDRPNRQRQWDFFHNYVAFIRA